MVNRAMRIVNWPSSLRRSHPARASEIDIELEFGKSLECSLQAAICDGQAG
jgi:hypothetical protein